MLMTVAIGSLLLALSAWALIERHARHDAEREADAAHEIIGGQATDLREMRFTLAAHDRSAAEADHHHQTYEADLRRECAALEKEVEDAFSDPRNAGALRDAALRVLEFGASPPPRARPAAAPSGRVDRLPEPATAPGVGAGGAPAKP